MHGRPSITGYDFQYKKTDEQTLERRDLRYGSPSSPYTTLDITLLDASTSYDVEVRAKNDEGTGPWSATGAGSTGNTDPAFSTSATTRDVAENTLAGANIGESGYGHGRRQRRLFNLYVGRHGCGVLRH